MQIIDWPQMTCFSDMQEMETILYSLLKFSLTDIPVERKKGVCPFYPQEGCFR